MAVTAITILGNLASTVDQTTAYTLTPSTSPTNGRTWRIGVEMTATVIGVLVPSVTGWSLTWSLIDSQGFGTIATPTRILAVFQATGDPGAGGNLTLSGDGIVTTTGCLATLHEITGGAAGSANTNKNASNSSAAPATTLTAFAAGSGILCYVASGSGSGATLTPNGGVLALSGDQNIGSPSTKLFGMKGTAEDLAPDGTLNGSAAWAMIAIEIPAASSGTVIPVIMNHLRNQGIA